MFETFQRRVRDPRTGTRAAVSLSGVAAAFTAVWLAVALTAGVGLFGIPPQWLAAFGFVCVLNAGIVGGGLWRVLVTGQSDPLTKRRRTGAGAVIGIVTYVTAAMASSALLTVSAVVGGASFDLFGALEGWGVAFILGLLMAVFSTAGIHFVLRVLVGHRLGARAETARATTGT